MKKDDKPDTLAVINNYNFYERHTHLRTWQLYNRPEGRVGEKTIIQLVLNITRLVLNMTKFILHVCLLDTASLYLAIQVLAKTMSSNISPSHTQSGLMNPTFLSALLHTDQTLITACLTTAEF